MTKKTEYKCDLCRVTREINELRGIHFTGSSFDFKHSIDCNTHICQKCIDRLLVLDNLEKAKSP